VGVGTGSGGIEAVDADSPIPPIVTLTSAPWSNMAPNGGTFEYTVGLFGHSDNTIRRPRQDMLPQIHYPPESSGRDWPFTANDIPARRWTTENHLGQGWSSHTGTTSASHDNPVRSLSGPGLMERDWKLNASGGILHASGGILNASAGKRGLLDSDIEEDNVYVGVRKFSGRLGGSGDNLGSSGVRDYEDLPPRSRSGPGMFGRDMAIAAMEARKQNQKKPLDIRLPLPQVKQPQLPPPHHSTLNISTQQLPPPHHSPLNVSTIVPDDFPLRRWSHDVPGRWSGGHESESDVENCSQPMSARVQGGQSMGEKSGMTFSPGDKWFS